MNEKDIVEVVRCKDCKNTDGETCQDGGIYCIFHKGWFIKDDYCSYGKRRQGE